MDIVIKKIEAISKATSGFFESSASVMLLISSVSLVFNILLVIAMFFSSFESQAITIICLFIYFIINIVLSIYILSRSVFIIMKRINE